VPENHFRAFLIYATNHAREKSFPRIFSAPKNRSAYNYFVDTEKRMFIIMSNKSRSGVKLKKNIWKCLFAPRNSRFRSISLSLSARTRVQNYRIFISVRLLKGWSLCTSGLEQHRLSSGKNPRKSFLPFPMFAKRRRHFPRGTNLLSFLCSPPPLRLFISLLLSHSPFLLLFARPSLISLQVRGLRPGKPGSNEKGD